MSSPVTLPPVSPVTSSPHTPPPAPVVPCPSPLSCRQTRPGHRVSIPFQPAVVPAANCCPALPKVCVAFLVQCVCVYYHECIEVWWKGEKWIFMLIVIFIFLFVRYYHLGQYDFFVFIFFIHHHYHFLFNSSLHLFLLPLHLFLPSS